MGAIQDTFYWAIIIFYRENKWFFQYLVVKNAETWNISFVSWAQEQQDKDLMDTAKREIQEELNIDSSEYELIPTSVKHEFTFWPKKKEREWKKGSYQVFRADWSKFKFINHSDQLDTTSWMTKEEVLNALPFDDLKEVFEKAILEIEL